MIELNEFEFPAKDFLRICRWQNGIHCCWVWCYVNVILLPLFIASNEWIRCPIAMVITGIVFFIFNYFMSRYYAFSKNFISMFQKRKLSFDDWKYYATTEDGSEGSGPLSHFQYAGVWKDYYLLYIVPSGFVPIPKSAFQSEEDRLRFETEILIPRLKKKPSFWKPVVIFLIISAVLIGTGFVLRSTANFSNDDTFETNYNEE
ncbi:MAG: hypothetical protein LBU34_07550 [Planctomycetaceae bacterium]|jgi:hypothetical protein|nr:hypothetical protein [Planctomycetaceae bacterium]